MPAFGCVERDDVIVSAQHAHAWPDIDHDARTFMADDGGKQTFGVST